MKLLAGVLALLTGVCIWALWALQDTRHLLASERQQHDVVLLDLSNRLATARQELDAQKRSTAALETNLAASTRQLEALRLDVATLNTGLARARSEAQTAQDETRSAQEQTRTAQEELKKRDVQIATLELRGADLTRQMEGLHDVIGGLERQITDTRKRLDDSEGNREVLLAELDRLQDEKLTLEKQMNDLDFVRSHVRKLREELSVARRLDRMRRGVYAGADTPKGGEALATMPLGSEAAEAGAAATAATPADLDVEIRRTGEIQLRQPGTNAPAGPR